MHNSTILTLNDVKDHFDHWRATRTKRGKIPACLWDEVKTLIGRYPTSQIAQTLRVNVYQISSGVNNKIDFTFVPARVTNGGEIAGLNGRDNLINFCLSFINYFGQLTAAHEDEP